MIAAFPTRLTARQIGLALLIVALAFTLRVIVTYQRAGGDPLFLPPDGTDPNTYLEQARGVLDGTFPTAPFYFHPGPAYVFAALIALLGDSVPLLLLAIAMLDALTAGLLIAAGWLLTRRPVGGYLAGLLYALYPLAVFYGTTPVIAPQAAFVLTLLIVLILWQRERIVWWRTLLMGLVGGALILLRLNLAPVLLLAGLWLVLLSQTTRQRIVHSILYTLMLLAVVAPITLHNYRSSGGQFIPVATTGILEIYLANNRDSNGQNPHTIAFETLDTDYQTALLRDWRAAPEHFFGLLVYKFAVFWDAADIGNNVSFANAQAVSPLLWLPLTFPLLAVVALPSLVALWKQDRLAALFLGLVLANTLASFLLVFVFGRLRHPAAPVLVLLAAYGISELLTVRRREFLKHTAPVFAAAILMVMGCWWVLNPAPRLPPERIYSTLPQDARVLDARFGDVLLRGWRPVPGWDASVQQWAQVGEAYAVELFWQIAQPVTRDYQFNLRYQQADGVQAEASRPLGSVSFPQFPTSLWESATIYGEIVSLRFDEPVADVASGQIRLGIWYWDSEGLIVNVPFSQDSVDIALHPFAVYSDDAEAVEIPPDALIFGEQIALAGLDVPPVIRAGDVITLRLHWIATAEIARDLRLFLHLEDENAGLAGQHDGLPVPDLFTQNWKPGHLLIGEYVLQMPVQPGTYRLYAGLYDEAGRMPVDALDNRPLLLSLRVE